ncbi:hypothetical protein ACF0H5_016250 [Mactra antiquata]
MIKMEKIYIILMLVVSVINSVKNNEMEYCPEGTYQPQEGAPCKDCSKCPDNQIVRETCWQNRDTVCGPFTEFHPFHRGENSDKLQSGNSGTNPVTEHEADDSGTTSWQTASTLMIILLAIMSVLCVVLIVTVCYRCRRDKKDGLMIYVKKDLDDMQAVPGCSGISASRSSSINNASEIQSNRCKDNPVNDTKQNKQKIQQFEIAEGSETT